MGSSSSSSRQGASSNEVPEKGKNRLLLHFDVNNTLLAADPVSGTGIVGAVNTFVAGILWGTEVNGAFELSSEPVSMIAPKEGMVSYYKFLEGQIEAAGRPRNDFKQLVAKFSEDPENELAAVAKRWVDDILSHLRTDIDNEHFTFEEGGVRYLLVVPSFWHLLSTLSKEGREFAIVLRTFGTDGPRLVETIHAFATGQHPEYPEGCPQAKMVTKLPVVMLDRSSPDGLRLLDEFEEVVAGGEAAVFNFLDKVDGTMACRDDFACWKKGGFAAAMGKPVWVPCAVAGSSSHHILFDDNIRVKSPENSIVDGRMLSRSSQDEGGWRCLGQCSQEETEAAGCLVPAELHRSTMDKNYFVDQVRQCEQRWKQFTAKYGPPPDSQKGDRCCM